MFIQRPRTEQLILDALRNNPVVAILGPRQCGKTTLARILAEREFSTYLDLEDPEDQSRLASPRLALERLNGLVILDEIQIKPELFPILRVLADRPAYPAKFLILGSASPKLIRGVSESLAGRVAFVPMSGFTLEEVEKDSPPRLWLRGGFPRSFLAANDTVSFRWRNDFISTFLERDIPQLGITIPSQTLRRFWTMLAHYHGQIWNASEIARSLGVSQKTIARYLDILTDAFVVRQLPPWHENLKKRQVKAPKIFIRDSGLLHSLLGLPSEETLLGHPKMGASYEGFVVEQIIDALGERNAYFWSTHSGAELDLVVFRQGQRLGFEIKHTDAPRLSKSMTIAMADVKLDLLYVVHPGRSSFPLRENIQALALVDLPGLLESFLK